METTNKYYKELKEIQQKYPELTFQNHGYQYLSKEVREKHKKQINIIEYNLNETIEGFVKFNNFKLRKDNTIVIRVQYHWDLSFVGVGYFPLNDFKDFIL